MKISKKNERKTLSVNTFMLYVLTFSNYLFGFITVPYQTRILGPEIYGIIGFASAMNVYFQLILDFGFILSATQEVTLNKNNHSKLEDTLSSVFWGKLILGFGCTLILCLLVLCISSLRSNWLLYTLYLIWAIITALLPDFLYRGMQEMQSITYRTILVKGFFVLMIFVFLKNKNQYYLVPLFNCLGSACAVIWAYLDINKKYYIKLRKVSLKTILSQMKVSVPFFISRVASTMYGATNTIVLKILYPTGPTVGYYTSADKIVTLARNGASPISDSLYPYMVEKKDFKIIKKCLLVFMPPILIGGILLWIFSVPFCEFLFGKEYVEAGVLLRYLIPIMIIILPTYILGFPTLAPLGLEKYANISNVIGAVVQVAGIVIMSLFDILKVETICIMTCITELTVLLIRLFTIFTNNLRLKRP